MEPHDEIENVLPPDALFWAMEPFGPPLGEAACSTWDRYRFHTMREQQAAFDGEPSVPERDIPQARAMCRTCPLLDGCRRYAQDSRDEHVFLAGETAEERRKTWRKTGEIAKRRRRVAELYALNVPTAIIARLLGHAERSIRSDVHELGKRSHLPPCLRRPAAEGPSSVGGSRAGPSFPALPRTPLPITPLREDDMTDQDATEYKETTEEVEESNAVDDELDADEDTDQESATIWSRSVTVGAGCDAYQGALRRVYT